MAKINGKETNVVAKKNSMFWVFDINGVDISMERFQLKKLNYFCFKIINKKTAFIL